MSKHRSLLTVASLLVAFIALAAPALAQAAAPAWRLTVTPNADYFIPGGYGVYEVVAKNIGSAPTLSSTKIMIENVSPSGTTAEKVKLFDSSLGQEDLGREGACPSANECLYPEATSEAERSLLGSHPLQPGQRLVMFVRVAVSSAGTLEDRARVSGGGAVSAEASATNVAILEPPFGPLAFASGPRDASEGMYTQAGGHPFKLATDFNFATYSTVVPSPPNNPNEYLWQLEGRSPVRDPKEIIADLPPGLVVNPQAAPRCSLADFFAQECEIKDRVGKICIRIGASTGITCQLEPIINLEPEGESPGLLGGTFDNGPLILINSGIRSGSDFGVRASSLSPEVGLNRADVTLWGVPGDPSHDVLRGIGGCPGFSLGLSATEFEQACEMGGAADPTPAETPAVPFITMPTECSGQELNTAGAYNSWQVPGEFARASDTSEAVSGCNQLSFAPEIEARPTTTLADAPSGLEFNLRVPQNREGPDGMEDPNGRATAELKAANVKLPDGLSINPSSANGLASCSVSQIGLITPVGTTPAHFTEAPAQCPDAAAIGTVEVDTALLHDPFKGTVYLATPNENPFGSLLAAYIVLEGHGLIFKLPGRIELDPKTGQITGKFLENPQLPFEEFHLRFFGGAKGNLRTPAVCGTYETTSQLTPFSHFEGEEEATPIAEPAAEFETTEGTQDGSCPRRAGGEPNAPILRAGTESPAAGAFSPLSIHLARDDGSQEISKIETALPPGLIARLAGVAECSDAQLAVAHSREHQGGGTEELTSPSCPSSSEVGKVEVASGAGPTPLYVRGHAYLAGPYKGAPLSLVIITPAVAGPFDLGSVVVRTALFVDQTTTQVKAVSDEIPHILSGIPLDVRSVTVKLNRPSFTLNPTNCEEMHIGGSATSVLGVAAPLSQRFQVGGCGALPFKPKLSLRVKGKVKRSGTPALTAVLTMPPGNANISWAQVTLPSSELLAQEHLENICTRVQFNERACPPDSVYGHAVAYTPLLDHPLEGPVYLRSNPAHKLPDLAVDLEGQIQVVLASKVDAVHASLRNTFEIVPDAPVSKFVLKMKGGKHSLIANKTNICSNPQQALALFKAQSGKSIELNPPLKASCHKGSKHHHRHKR